MTQAVGVQDLFSRIGEGVEKSLILVRRNSFQRLSERYLIIFERHVLNIGGAIPLYGYLFTVQLRRIFAVVLAISAFLELICRAAYMTVSPREFNAQRQLMGDSVDLMTHAMANFFRSYVEEIAILGFLGCRFYDFAFKELRYSYKPVLENEVGLFPNLISQHVDIEERINALRTHVENVLFRRP